MYKIKRNHAYLVILLVFFIQLLLSNFLGFSIIKPNLMIITVTFFAIFTDRKFGFEAGFLSGMLLDIFSIRFFGLNAVLLAFGGYLTGKYNNKFYKDSIITHVILTFVISFFVLSLYFLFLNLRNLSILPLPGLNDIFGPPIIISSLLNSFLGIWMYAFFIRVFQLSKS